MEKPEPAHLLDLYNGWFYRLNGSKKSRHHLVPRCRWGETHQHLANLGIGELKKGECISTTNELHALWHHLFSCMTPLEIIRQLQMNKFDLRKLNEWQIISWLILFYDLKAEEACCQIGVIQPRLITDRKTIEMMTETVIYCWSPRIFQEFQVKELLAFAA